MHINAITALGLGFGGQNMNLLLQKLKLQRLQKLQLTQAFRGFSGPCQPSPRCPERVHFCRADNFYLLSLKVHVLVFWWFLLFAFSWKGAISCTPCAPSIFQRRTLTLCTLCIALRFEDFRRISAAVFGLDARSRRNKAASRRFGWALDSIDFNINLTA